MYYYVLFKGETTAFPVVCALFPGKEVGQMGYILRILSYLAFLERLPALAVFTTNFREIFCFFVV
jgi:hypothetical protein